MDCITIHLQTFVESSSNNCTGFTLVIKYLDKYQFHEDTLHHEGDIIVNGY